MLQHHQQDAYTKADVHRKLKRVQQLRKVLDAEETLLPTTDTGLRHAQERQVSAAAVAKARNHELLQALADASADAGPSAATCTLDAQLLALHGAYLSLVHKALPAWLRKAAPHLARGCAGMRPAQHSPASTACSNPCVWASKATAQTSKAYQYSVPTPRHRNNQQQQQQAPCGGGALAGFAVPSSATQLPNSKGPEAAGHSSGGRLPCAAPPAHALVPQQQEQQSLQQLTWTLQHQLGHHHQPLQQPDQQQQQQAASPPTPLDSDPFMDSLVSITSQLTRLQQALQSHQQQQQQQWRPHLPAAPAEAQVAQGAATFAAAAGTVCASGAAGTASSNAKAGGSGGSSSVRVTDPAVLPAAATGTAVDGGCVVPLNASSNCSGLLETAAGSQPVSTPLANGGVSQDSHLQRLAQRVQPQQQQQQQYQQVMQGDRQCVTLFTSVAAAAAAAGATQSRTSSEPAATPGAYVPVGAAQTASAAPHSSTEMQQEQQELCPEHVLLGSCTGLHVRPSSSNSNSPQSASAASEPSLKLPGFSSHSSCVCTGYATGVNSKADAHSLLHCTTSEDVAQQGEGVPGSCPDDCLEPAAAVVSQPACCGVAAAARDEAGSAAVQCRASTAAERQELPQLALSVHAGRGGKQQPDPVPASPCPEDQDHRQQQHQAQCEQTQLLAHQTLQQEQQQQQQTQRQAQQQAKFVLGQPSAHSMQVPPQHLLGVDAIAVIRRSAPGTSTGPQQHKDSWQQQQQAQPGLGFTDSGMQQQQQQPHSQGGRTMSPGASSGQLQHLQPHPRLQQQCEQQQLSVKQVQIPGSSIREQQTSYAVYVPSRPTSAGEGSAEVAASGAAAGDAAARLGTNTSPDSVGPDASRSSATSAAAAGASTQVHHSTNSPSRRTSAGKEGHKPASTALDSADDSLSSAPHRRMSAGGDGPRGVFVGGLDGSAAAASAAASSALSPTASLHLHQQLVFSRLRVGPVGWRSPGSLHAAEGFPVTSGSPTAAAKPPAAVAALRADAGAPNRHVVGAQLDQQLAAAGGFSGTSPAVVQQLVFSPLRLSSALLSAAAAAPEAVCDAEAVAGVEASDDAASTPSSTSRSSQTALSSASVAASTTSQASLQQQQQQAMQPPPGERELQPTTDRTSPEQPASLLDSVSSPCLNLAASQQSSCLPRLQERQQQLQVQPQLQQQQVRIAHLDVPGDAAMNDSCASSAGPASLQQQDMLQWEQLVFSPLKSGTAAGTASPSSSLQQGQLAETPQHHQAVYSPLRLAAAAAAAASRSVTMNTPSPSVSAQVSPDRLLLQQQRQPQASSSVPLAVGLLQQVSGSASSSGGAAAATSSSSGPLVLLPRRSAGQQQLGISSLAVGLGGCGPGAGDAARAGHAVASRGPAAAAAAGSNVRQESSGSGNRADAAAGGLGHAAAVGPLHRNLSNAVTGSAAGTGSLVAPVHLGLLLSPATRLSLGGASTADESAWSSGRPSLSAEGGGAHTRLSVGALAGTAAGAAAAAAEGGTPAADLVLGATAGSGAAGAKPAVMASWSSLSSNASGASKVPRLSLPPTLHVPDAPIPGSGNRVAPGTHKQGVHASLPTPGAAVAVPVSRADHQPHQQQHIVGGSIGSSLGGAPMAARQKSSGSVSPLPRANTSELLQQLRQSQQLQEEHLAASPVQAEQTPGAAVASSGSSQTGRHVSVMLTRTQQGTGACQMQVVQELQPRSSGQPCGTEAGGGHGPVCPRQGIGSCRLSSAGGERGVSMAFNSLKVLNTGLSEFSFEEGAASDDDDEAPGRAQASVSSGSEFGAFGD